MKVNFSVLKNFLVKSNNNGHINLNIDKNSTIYNKIQQELPELQKIVQRENRPILFAPKGDNATLMNFGPFTTVLKNDDLQSKIASQMYDHISKVRMLQK